MKQVTIPFNVDHMSVNEMKIIIGMMRGLKDAAYDMRNSFREDSAERFLSNCEDFYWKFQAMTKDLSTYAIVDKEYEAGREAAAAEMRSEGFDVAAALQSFEGDPADTPFQRGYQRQLEGGV